ncbi:MAG: glycosyltransferase family 87 protein [Terricaulis sp.]
MLLRRSTAESLAIACTFVLLVVMASRTYGVINNLLVDGHPLYGDFIAFWSAAKATLQGHVADIHDRVFLAKVQVSAVPNMHVMAPYNSPPILLLLITPLGLLPYNWAAITFLVLTGALYLWTARKLLPDNRAMIFACTLPAAVYHIGTVQELLLIAGLNGLALFWLDKRPRLSGAIVGLLAIKPHLAVLWPIFLALSGRWKNFAAATISIVALGVTAGLVFGWPSYLRFYQNLGPSADLIFGVHVAKQTYASLFGNMRAIGLTIPQAWVVHGISAALGLAASAVVFRKGDWQAQCAAFCAATLLMSPYLYFYDFALLGVGAACLGAPRNRLEFVAQALAWGSAYTVALGPLAGFPLCPISAWAVLLVALRRVLTAKAPSETAALDPVPAPQT